ncbi:Trihelix transcription factor GT-3b [Canna indica]|uniref:Trihelix transcription factor GT-3b n=1 Tax=Canna indica TaxID=4628 RepID=A0AAQ3JU17_9LILI|nr:Trihelix transcription factor GT-3b [Canna indica]
MMFGGGGGDGEPLGGRMAMLAGIQIQMNPPPAAETVGTSGGGGGGQPQRGGGGKEERVPQWGQQETRDLIAIRAQLERDPALAPRNRTLWEAVAARMRERGYRRTPDQCKCKWKNLVNRYKGKETSDPEHGRQCPFFDELSAVFMEREKNMHRLLLESESGSSQSKKRLKRLSSIRSSDDFSDGDEDEDDNDSDEERLPKSKKKKADSKGSHQQQRAKAATTTIQELLQEFLQQQQQMELQWFKMMERRARERRLFEQEWRQSMEKLERERLMLEQAWREREEQRRMREESRAEKRDALLATLLNKLIQEDP